MKVPSESLFQSWFKQNPDAVFIMDQKGSILEIINQVSRQFNISYEQLIQLIFNDLFIWPELEADKKMEINKLLIYLTGRINHVH
jgi:hypothetical protein